MLPDVATLIFIDFLYQKITSVIAYFAAVAQYNLVCKDFKSARKFRAGSYGI